MENVEDIYPLAPIQEGLLFHTLSDDTPGVYIEQVCCALADSLDVDAFKHAWAHVIQRHGALRTCFLWEDLDAPLQVVRQQVTLPWRQLDWTDRSKGQAETALHDLLRQDRAQGIDLGDAPLMHMTLVRRPEAGWYWLWTFHHLVADGWSTALLLREVFEACQVLASGAEPDPSPGFAYARHIAWLGRCPDAEGYWREQLSGFAQRTPLDFAPEKPVRTPPRAHAQHQFTLPAALSDDLRQLATQCRVTLNTLIQAAWGLMLAKYAHSDDVVFGVTLSGRAAELEGVEQAVGLFINTLPLRLSIDADCTLAAFLAHLQRQQMVLQQWQHSALADVQRWSDMPPGQALFDSILVFENYPDSETLMGGRYPLLQHIDIFQYSNFPLALLVLPGESIGFLMVCDPTRFDAAVVASLFTSLQTLLRAMAERPDARLGDYALVDAQGYRQLMSRSNPATTVLPDVDSVVDLFDAQVRRAPDATAVEFDGRQWRYGQLHELAGRIASGLVQKGIERGSRIGLLTERSVDMIAGILGILKSGCSYVPLDPGYPADHLAYLLDDAALAAVVVSEGAVDSLAAGGVTLYRFADLSIDVEQARGGDPVRLSRDDDAYVIYTSGSTGRPKGVVVNHLNLLASTAARLDYYSDPVGRYLLLSSFAFDSSVAGIFWTLCTGGTLVLPRTGDERDPREIARLVDTHRVSHLLCLPALWQLLLEHVVSQRPGSLRTVIVAGEACPPALIERTTDRLPRVRVYNEYGPTECTVWSTVYDATGQCGVGPVPIGRPVANTRVLLLDRHRQPMPAGAVGEIYVAGKAVSAGYLDRPQLTGERFVDVRLGDGSAERTYRTGDLARYRDDGELIFLGRADAQLKIRGYRIEPQEIEAVIRQLAGVAQVAVFATAADGQESAVRRLAACIVFADSHRNDAQDIAPRLEALRRQLGTTLPAHMVPEVLFQADELPHLSNGKVDTQRLASLAGAWQPASDGHSEPANETEHLIATIWAELLGLERVPVDVDFFALGGNSLDAVRLFAQIESRTGTRLPVSTLARHGSVRGIAEHIRQMAQPIRGALVPLQVHGHRVPVFCPHAGGETALFYRHLAARLGTQQPLYALQPPGLEGEGGPPANFAALAARYIEDMRTIQPEGPYYLMGHCQGAVVGLEMARQLLSQGHRVARLIILDSGFWWGGQPKVAFVARAAGEKASSNLIGKAMAVARDRGPLFLSRLIVRNVTLVFEEQYERAASWWRLRTADPAQRRAILRARVEQACDNAFAAYKPVSVDVQAVLVRTTQSVHDPEKQRHLRWRDYTADLEVTEIDVQHDTMLLEPEVQETARVVAFFLPGGRHDRCEAGSV